MKQRRAHPRRHGPDRITASLAAGAMVCLMVLGGCGPQNGAPLDNIAMREASAAKPVPAAPVAAKPVPVAQKAAPVREVVREVVSGEVRHIKTLTERPKGTGVGAVAGGVVGGVLGHQVGDGNGQKVATAAGAVGGALLGNKIERDRKTRVVGYRVDVKLDNGETRSFRRSSLGGLQVGSRVKVEAGSLHKA